MNKISLVMRWDTIRNILYRFVQKIGSTQDPKKIDNNYVVVALSLLVNHSSLFTLTNPAALSGCMGTTYSRITRNTAYYNIKCAQAHTSNQNVHTRNEDPNRLKAIFIIDRTLNTQSEGLT